MADEIKFAEYIYARAKNSMGVKIEHEESGDYRVEDERGNIIQTGWMARVVRPRRKPRCGLSVMSSNMEFRSPYQAP